LETAIQINSISKLLTVAAEDHGYHWLFGGDSTAQFTDIFGSAFYFAKWAGLVLVVGLSPVVVLYLALGALAIIELVMRRLAEHPKGPIIAVSLIVSSIAAVIKSFN
jgi:hypothetical protein